MRYKVVVTKVEVAERWVRAVDEEAAAEKVRAELAAPWAYAGSWELKATDVQVVESEPSTNSPHRESVSEAGSKLLNQKEAASELGISYGTFHALMKAGEIEYTQVGSRKYVTRESLADFIEKNSRR